MYADRPYFENVVRFGYSFRYICSVSTCTTHCGSVIPSACSSLLSTILSKPKLLCATRYNFSCVPFIVVSLLMRSSRTDFIGFPSCVAFSVVIPWHSVDGRGM